MQAALAPLAKRVRDLAADIRHSAADMVGTAESQLPVDIAGELEVWVVDLRGET